MFACKFRENFAIENHVLFLETIDEARVRCAVQASTRIDADLLQATVIALLEFTVAVGVGTRFGGRGFSESDFALAPPHHSFGAGQDILASLDAMHSTFYARHRLGVRHE